MANLLRELVALVDDQAARDACRADPGGYAAAIDPGLTGEDVEVALEVIRVQIHPEAAARLDPDRTDPPFPTVVAPVEAEPFEVAVQCLVWMADALDEPVVEAAEDDH